MTLLRRCIAVRHARCARGRCRTSRSACKPGKIGELVEANEALAKLEHLLSRNSGNSSSPPSRDDDPGSDPSPGKKRAPGVGTGPKGKQTRAPKSHLAWTDTLDGRENRFPQGKEDLFMLSAKPELIWQGRVHLGDEPGVYGDAFYSGLATELPVTLNKTDLSGPDVTTLVLQTQNVETFSGYPGHLIRVTLYEQDPDQQFHFIETPLATERLTSADNNRQEVAINLANRVSPIFVSVRIRIDTEVPPGLYDDFVVTSLLNKSQNFTFVASLGFHA